MVKTDFMKKILLFILIIAGLAACKKENQKPVISPGLFGKWELRRVHGGLAGLDSTLAEGNGTIFQFKSDSTYVHFFQNSPNAQGTFRIIKSGYDGGGVKYDEVIFGTDISGDPIILNETKLIIGTTIADGFEYDYEKISN